MTQTVSSSVETTPTQMQIKIANARTIALVVLGAYVGSSIPWYWIVSAIGSGFLLKVGICFHILVATFLTLYNLCIVFLSIPKPNKKVTQDQYEEALYQAWSKLFKTAAALLLIHIVCGLPISYYMTH